MAIVGISVLVIIILVLIFYNIHLRKMLDANNNLNQKVNSLSVLQSFMDVVGEQENVDNKLNKINEIIIEKYDIKYRYF